MSARWLRLLAPLLALLGACRGESPPAARPVFVAYPLIPQSLVPDAELEEIAFSIQGNIYEGLVAHEEGLVPMLAESWETIDDRTWVFRLRRGVLLHDGRTLTAGDVVAALRHAVEDPASAVRSGLAVIASVEASSPERVVVRTREACGDLLYRLPTIWVPPREAGGLPVGTGPYRVLRFRPGREIALEAFLGYRAPPPSVRRLEFRALPEAHLRLAALEQGQVQLVPDLPSEYLATIASMPGVRRLSREGLRVIYLGLDCAGPRLPSGQPNPFLDVRVRQAVQLAVDRSALVRGPLGGLGSSADQIIVREVVGYDDTLEPLRYDPAGARRLLAEAGHASGFDVSLDVPQAKYRSIEAVAAELGTQLGQVGLRVKPQATEAERFFGEVLPQGSALFLSGWMSGPDAGTTFDYLLHTREGGLGADNYSRYSNPAMDALLDELRHSLKPERRQRLQRLAAREMREDAPLVPLYRQVDLYAVAAGLEFRPRRDRKILGVELSWSASPAP